MSESAKPGSIVICRQRQWVVLPSDNSEVVRLRPLSGNEEQICGVFTRLGLENIEPAQFAPPNPDTIQNHTAAQLLMDATRLSLRSGAGPFRCLGRLSVRPRPYQLVPLLMALRLETVRLLIADDVGIGKTIEAGLIIRELLDRGEAKRMAVLCPPQLCDQWQRELKQKFHIDAVVVRSGTVSKLERSLPAGDSHIFSYYPHLIVSLDYVKSDRRRETFLVHCPDLVIVDEAHTCTHTGGERSTQQQRHQLVQKIAAKSHQHLILLTATPHSGIEASFLSLLGLLNPEFKQFSLDQLNEKQRIELARHFVQRRRIDIQHWLGNETPFPERVSQEKPYSLSKEYRQLFEAVYDFAWRLVKTAEETPLSHAQRRGRYWSALAILRCVMSSPAAAIATLSRQTEKYSVVEETTEDFDEELAATYVYDSTEQEQILDVVPTTIVEKGKQTFDESQKRQLREFVILAKQLQGTNDRKLHQVKTLVKTLLQDGLNPIIWCRYIATAKYVAEALKELETKKTNLRVIAITGEQSEDEREIRLEELKNAPQRILVATDCLSEGINLQEHFTAAIHYDLPWNPNRLEQREGRIDRYGQTAPQVKCFLLYGQDNPIDGAVLQVLIRKAVEIHKSLGITVPVPMDSSTVQEAVFKSLFERAAEVKQLTIFDLLDDLGSPLVEVHKNWDKAVEREKLNRTRFAQRAIKPEEVQQELIESDQILGSETDVEQFVKTVCEKLSCSLIKQKKSWNLPNIPLCVQPVLGDKSRLITFSSPAPEGVEYIGRNHPLVEGLARYILEESLAENQLNPIAARCGVTVTEGVSKPTVILLLRIRHLLESSKGQILLAEEALVRGFTGSPANANWLSAEESLDLVNSCEPVGNLPIENKRNRINLILDHLKDLQPNLEMIAQERAQVLAASHHRVRELTKAGKVKVKPQLPLDILGIYLLIPK